MVGAFLLSLVPFFWQDIDSVSILEGCRKCDFRGVVVCKNHPKELVEMESQVEFCSVAAQCEDCFGSFLLACAKCEGGPKTDSMLKRREVIAQHAQEASALEKFLESSLIRVQTAHIHVSGNLEEVRNKKKRISGHAFMHHVARDGERVATLVNAHFGAKPKHYRSPMFLWFWEDLETHRNVIGHFLGSGTAGDFKWLGKDPRFSVHCGDETFGFDAVTLHTLGVHNVGHMLVSNLFTEVWIGDMGGGWFDSGSAHWYEEAVFQKVRHHCIDEIAYSANYSNGLWRAALRKHLARNDDSVILPSLVRKLTGSMSALEHALSWSFYDWLVNQHPSKLAPILKGLKKRTPERDLFSEYLEMNFRQTEEAWRDWVGENYPKKEPSRRR